VGNAKQKQISFDSFRLDLANECLWRDSRAIKVRPKAFAVLHYLLGRPGQLVTKEELLNAVWPQTFVGEAVLKVAIRQIREALGDDSTSPRFIETAHRRGYRFISQIVGSDVVSGDPEIRTHDSVTGSPQHRSDFARGVVGRERDLSLMQSRLERMIEGERQILFVTGEAGIGKTALVDTFARSIASGRDIRISRGQCLEQYGTGEAYLPVLDAIDRLCREQRQVIDVLRAHAPLWLLQMPSLLTASDRELLSREVSGATRERMLREMGDALEALTADLPLVLILEDLHWSDYSTLDLISYLANQRHAARLMLIGTYRTVELIVSGHPLKEVKRELLAKQQCAELPLEYLSNDAVAQYLSVRFPNNRFPLELAALIHERTEGSPLFMVNAVDYLLTEGSISEHGSQWELSTEIEKVDVGVPDSVKQMIQKQVDHLDGENQRILEAASVAGSEFTALAVMAGLQDNEATVEARCEELARQRQFIRDCGIRHLPGGGVVPKYGFIHALYQNVLYERLSSSRRIQLHRRIGAQEEQLYGDHAAEIAAELAMHFERGANYKQAVEYLQQAAENALRQFAYREAVGLSRRGLELIERLPATAERARQELALRITLGVPLIATEGYATPDVGTSYTRARELCRQVGETPEISQVLWGLWTFYVVRAELGTAHEIAQEFLRLAGRLPYSGLTMEVTLMHLGDFAQALEHFEKAFVLYDPERHRDDAFRYSLNSGVSALCYAGWTLWFLGAPDRALERIEQALALARDLSEPHGWAHTLFYAAVLHQFRREDQKALERAEAAIAVSGEHGLVLYQAAATVIRGWALTEQGQHEEAIEQIRQALVAYQATGTVLLRPHFLALLAEALGRARQAEEGLRVVEEALALGLRSGEQYYHAELYRLKGELLMMQAGASIPEKTAHVESPAIAETEGSFHESMRIAQKQKAKSLELRAATSLARLHQNQGKHREARSLLSQVFGGFTEGFETMDLREAKALLEKIPLK
jgi:DNA-binding winged helix-turn-helix (wHTH) protein/predicted ATPase